MVIPNNIVDVHSHILPGIDDGARSLQDSVEIARWLVRQGVTDVIATPHYVDETEYCSSGVHNLDLLNELREELKKQDIKLNVYLGNELYINERILDLLKSDTISTLAGSNYLLIELPLSGEFPNYEGYFRDLMDSGYRVLLAHPERYTSFQSDYSLARNLYEMGVLFQCNYGSFVGRYGVEAQSLAHRFAKDKMIFTLGSDSHRASSTEYITAAREKLLRDYNEREISQLIRINPEKILLNRD